MGRPSPRRGRQQGVTLIVTLIMLMAMALLAAWAVTSGTTNQRVVGNQQAREEALSAAQNAVETAISTADFTLKTAALAAAPVTIDLDGDGTIDMQARLTPQPNCFRTRQVQEEELEVETRPEDKVCLRSEDTLSAGAGTNCQATEWNIRAEATDERTGATVAVNQGVGLRVLGPGALCTPSP
jgi:type II secretory pathway pseudopilin PulG